MNASEAPSADLRRHVWDAGIEADMRHRYFTRMAQRAATLDRALRIALIFASSATAAAVFGVLDFGPELLAVLTALLAAVTGTLQLGAAAAKHTGFAVDWGHIHNAAVDLWIELERGALSHHEVRDRLRALQHQHEAIDRQSISDRVNAKILVRCFDEAEAYAFAPQE